MCLEGLYRSLLFEAWIQSFQCPDLIPRVFPGLWERLSSGAAPPQQTPMRFEEVKAAFGRLTKESQSFDGYICFWINGLDEFEGDEADHWRLARDLQRWTESNHIKLCVSSRPYIPFTQSFAKDLNHQISIHNLTREDMRQFSLAMFEKDPNFHRVKDSYQRLTSKVVEGANGVFLWARLVVRSLLKSIGYQSMAKGLEIFDRILGSVDPDDRPLSDKLFLMRLLNNSIDRGVPNHNAMAYSRIEDLDDPNFPENQPMCVSSKAEIKEQIPRASCILDRLSRGLLEMTPTWRREVDGHEYYKYDVGFLHRTVREYIANTRRDQIQSRVPEFDAHVGLIRLLIADFKFARPTRSDLIPKPSGRGLPPIRQQLLVILFFLVNTKGAGKTDILPGFLAQACYIVAGHATTRGAFRSTTLRKQRLSAGKKQGEDSWQLLDVKEKIGGS